MSLIFSIVESPSHPDFSPLYRELGLEEIRSTSMRKAIAALKSHQPDWWWQSSSTDTATTTPG